MWRSFKTQCGKNLLCQGCQGRVQEEEVLKQHLEEAEKERQKFKTLAIKRKEERDVLKKKVESLESDLCSCSKENAVLVQKVEKLTACLRRCKQLVAMAEQERDSSKKEQEHLQKSVSGLEATLAAYTRKHHRPDVEARDVSELQTPQLRDKLKKLAKEMEKSEVMEKMRIKERDLFVKRYLEQGALLNSEQKRQKQNMERTYTTLQHYMTEVEDIITLSEIQYNAADVEIQLLRRERDQLKIQVAELMNDLALEREHHDQEERALRQYISERNAMHTKHFCNFHTPVKPGEEKQACVKVEREKKTTDQEQPHCEEHETSATGREEMQVDQLESSSVSDSESDEQGIE